MSKPSALQLNVTSIASVADSGTIIEEIEFDRPVAEVVELVEQSLGHAPTIEHRDEHPCSMATDVTFYTWEAYSVRITHEQDPGAVAAWRQPGDYRVTFGSAGSIEIELRGTEALRVGDDATAFLAALPPADVQQVSDSAFWALVDDGGEYSNELGSGSWGLAAIIEGGVVTSFTSPTYPLDAFC